MRSAAMTLQQLRFLAAVVQNDLNITAASANDPACLEQAAQILEQELGFAMFVRSGRAFTKVTPAGERVVAHALDSPEIPPCH